MLADNKLKNATLIRSKEIDEVIGKPPHWLIQWGISVFFIVLVLVLSLSYFIKYPETITVPFKLISNNPSIPESINENGSLIKLSVNEGMHVHKNDILFSWKESNSSAQHAFISDLDGRINFISPLFNGQKLEKRQFLFYIMPPGSVYYAILYINSSEIRRIKVGQNIKLDLQEYPRSQYGYINCVIDYVSTVKNLTGYYVRAKLPKGLISDLNKIIPFRNGLSGNAEIIINKRKLIDKFIYK